MKKRIHRWLSRVKNCLREWLDLRKYLRYLNTCNRKNVYVLGTPVHTNVGDLTIAYAELLFLENCGIEKKHIKEITVYEYKKYEKHIAKKLRGKNRLICMHGGGNMGNQWPEEEAFRRHVMEQLDINPMIILPQTFFYTNDEKGQRSREESVPYYNQRSRLTITAREKRSYELLKNSYPDADIILTPDIVLSMDPAVLNVEKKERKGILFVLRTDGERLLTDDETAAAMQTVKNMGYEYGVTDMITTLTPYYVGKAEREEVIRAKLNEFAGAEVVIADRLHAMVFAAISNTPCIVLRNNNHKITGTYEWISGLPYIKMADGISQVEQYLPELMMMKDFRYDPSAYSTEYSALINAVKRNL